MRRRAHRGSLAGMARALTQNQILTLASHLPSERPYTAAEAGRLGVNSHHRRLLVHLGFIKRPVHGVFYAAGLQDSLTLRLDILKLVVPPDCVVTDRTAAWLWGATMALAPNDHRQVPRVSVFAPPGRRLRNGLTASGERVLSQTDVVDMRGLLVTTPLRTACDLGRLLHRDQALAAMDAVAALGMFPAERIAAEMERFKGYRGVVQGRALAPLVDPESQSQMESISRMRWYDAGLPRPKCQVRVDAPDGGFFAIDIGLPGERFGLEYFGEEWHGPDEEGHDERRLDWLRVERLWTIIVARKANVLGPQQDLEQTLRVEWAIHQSLARR